MTHQPNNVSAAGVLSNEQILEYGRSFPSLLELLTREPARVAFIQCQRALLAAASAQATAQAAQEPVATLHDDGHYTWHGAKPHDFNYAGWRMKVYAAPSPAAREAGDGVRDVERDAARYRWLHGEHFPTAEKPPLAQVVWKAFDDRHSGQWANMIDGHDLDAAIDAALSAQPAKE